MKYQLKNNNNGLNSILSLGAKKKKNNNIRKIRVILNMNNAIKFSRVISNVI